jgi:hypothetical protein
MLARKILVFVCAFILSSSLYAEPLNVLVGDITFTRPQEWTWDSPDAKSQVLTRFIIPNDSDKPTTDVRFYLTKIDAASASALWRSYFPQSNADKDIREEKKKIGKHDVTYISLSGTHIYPGKKPRPNCTFFGAVIPSGHDFVHIRMFGPTSEVTAASGRFKKMVEDALREKEDE